MATRKLTQTGQSSDPLDLEPARDRLPLLEIDPEKIVDAFEAELKTLSSESEPLAVHETAQRLVTKIQALIPTPEAQLNSGYPLTGLASLFITIAADIPSRHVGQDLLVETVREIGASPEPAWSEGFLKSLGMMMRDRWSGFTIDNGEDEDEVYTPDQWLNLNSFNARLFGSGITRWYTFGVQELRDALEEELGTNPDNNDCQVAVASEWLIQAAPKLLRENLRGESGTPHKSRGTLWHGAPGLGAERWGFWKRRLGEVRGNVKTPVALSYLEQAEKAMADAERDLVS